MSIFFCNKEAIDLNMIRLMGVNVKVTETPIGFFGTGLKFAIATLLRNEQTFQLYREGVEHFFATETVEVRGENVDVVTLDGERLGFTTDVGRQWEVWEAYRELHSNALDEGGIITREPVDLTDFHTVIIVSGEAVCEAYENRGDIFLSPEREPITKWCDVEVFEGASQFGFYRGIRAIKHSAAAAFTYNVTQTMELTEDRTIKYDFMYRHHIERMVACLTSFDLLERILLANNDFESQLDFSSHGNDVSDEFLAVCDEHQKDDFLNSSAHKLWKTKQPPRVVIERIERLESEKDKLSQAAEFLKLAGSSLDMGSIVVVDHLPSGRYADLIDDTIVIEKVLFEMEPADIAQHIFPYAICLNEEVKRYGYSYDEAVLDALFSLTKKVKDAIDRRRVFKTDGNY